MVFCLSFFFVDFMFFFFFFFFFFNDTATTEIYTLSLHDALRSALADPRLTTKNFPFDARQFPPTLQNRLAPFVRVMNKGVLHNAASEHDRLRRPLNRAFHPARFERLRPEMEAFTHQ